MERRALYKESTGWCSASGLVAAKVALILCLRGPGREQLWKLEAEPACGEGCCNGAGTFNMKDVARPLVFSSERGWRVTKHLSFL